MENIEKTWNETWKNMDRHGKHGKTWKETWKNMERDMEKTWKETWKNIDRDMDRDIEKNIEIYMETTWLMRGL